MRRTGCPPSRRELKHVWLGHPREETSRDRPNFSLAFLPRGGPQPGLASGRCPCLPVETPAEHTRLCQVRTTCFCRGGGRGEKGDVPSPKQGGEQRVFPSQQPGAPARAPKLMRCPCSGRAKSKAPWQPHSHAFTGAPEPSRRCSRTSRRVARSSGAQPSLRRARVFPSSGKRPHRSGRKARQGPCASQLRGETPLRAICVTASENRPALSAKEREQGPPQKDY